MGVDHFLFFYSSATGQQFKNSDGINNLFKSRILEERTMPEKKKGTVAFNIVKFLDPKSQQGHVLWLSSKLR